MDTHSTEFPVSAPEALRRLVDQVLGGGDAILAAANGGGQDLLDQAAERLEALRLRVLRASAAAPGGLSLSGLMAQVTGQPDLTAHDDKVLDRGFQALTVPGAGCDGIVLMIGGAEALQRTALRYLQFACRAGSSLRLVLAGEHGPDLAGDEVSHLRTRLAAYPVITVAGGMALAFAPRPAVYDAGPDAGHDGGAPLPAGSPVPMAQPAPAAEASAQPALFRPALSQPAVLLARPAARSGQRIVWAVVAMGMAGSAALGLWAGRQGQLGAEHPPALAGFHPPALAGVQPAPTALPALPTPAGAVAAGAPPPAAPDADPGVSPPTPQPASTPPRPVASGREAPALPQAAAPPRPAAHPREQATARHTPGSLPRALAAARPPDTRNRPAVNWDRPLPTPLQEARPWRAPPPYPLWEIPPRMAGPAIGTFATDEYGIRSFRPGP